MTKKLLQELLYAYKLHQRELAYNIKEQKKVIKEKDFIIRCLKAPEKLQASDFKKAISILISWKKNHQFWISLIKKDKRWAQKGGSIKWHMRWVSTYDSIRKLLRQK